MPELPLTMPKMSMTMEEGTVVSWLKAPGDEIREGEPVCEVATDKVDMEVESPYSGTLARIEAEIGDILPVGETLAFITTDADDLLGGLLDVPGPEVPAAEPGVAPSGSTVTAAESEASKGSAGLEATGGSATIPAATGGPRSFDDSAATAGESAAPSETAALSPVAAGATVPSGTAGRVPSVPAARALAARHGIDLASVTATGPWGAVRLADVEAAVAAPPSASRTDDRRARTRRRVAEVMTASAAVPQFTVFAELDLSRAERARHDLLAGAGWTALLVRAHALALLEHPSLRAHWGEAGPAPDEGVGVALAVDSPAGLLAPVIGDPQDRTIADVSAAVRDVVTRARDGGLRPEDLAGGTTVVSNLGGFGVERFTALLTPPHATALSVGAVAQRLVVHPDGSFGPRLGCTVGLTVDHRVADGADAARYLETLAALLSDPVRLR
ncbi:dihydrolipoamide acetyltransferase family protein [Sediminivirga luteola]|uniref:Dihydrolipoamide acetyltransferase component of pyruvate dehydrogenase complex n=1 Tax=Sediminivirga luteola TaxID=1774748 RepID=A0A8J2TVA1_9MICO|nr:dihydrolipoamide acetyltransferase family protein [Sediminivirga luteola]GGA03386.1 acetyltransferase component of pyruvate dehydrogenase complex [Sediminivirga luteola]